MSEKRNIIVFAPSEDSPGKRDATGAFIPQAKAFCEHHEVPEENLILIDNTKSKPWMRNKVIEHILGADIPADEDPLDAVVFFCHGWKSGIQFGFSNGKKDIDPLAKAIADRSIEVEMMEERLFTPVIPLYCCSTGRDADRESEDDLEVFGGEGGFADSLRDGLCRAGAIYCRVLAHTTAGHTTQNPHVREFLGNGRSLGGEGGSYIIPKKNPKHFRAWRKQLLEDSDFRFDFPFMTTEEIQLQIDQLV